ncbi:MAG: tRNA (adenosine(37)-N6)-threonylcarbamoyltransferase complex transferase subunit TsaD [Candidatus Magasanikbacteria bacterium]|nr:tRNA (adenosine(37)-N6)-threonylcarbamoyltransferase complex transferase subunit TsaD [Candidatus Magasanikbacteria bacterium]
MRILGIESSCDDTSVALIAADNDVHILAEKTASQVDIHKKYGGVVPEVAARMHAEAILPVVEAVMSGQNKPDAIAVTAGPGLITSLVVGVEAAKALSYLWEVPLIRVNHIAGHIHSALLQKPQPAIRFPALCLVVSGGHTELIIMRDHGVYELLGATLDDAAGECFDKVAKLLGYDYPGGPKISQLAEGGNQAAIAFPRPMLQEKNLNFSFAGLKTAALYWLRDHSLTSIPDFCGSFEQAIVDVLVKKTIRAVADWQPKTIILAGGVAANKKLRHTLRDEVGGRFPETLFLTPNPSYCMDNGAMIAVAGYYQARQKKFIAWRDIEADPNWRVENKNSSIS